MKFIFRVLKVYVNCDQLGVVEISYGKVHCERMDNETIFAYKEKIAITETGIASIAAVISDNWSQLPLDDAIIKFFDNSTAAGGGSSGINVIPTATSTNSTFQNLFNTINSWNIFGMNFIPFRIITTNLLIFLILI